MQDGREEEERDSHLVTAEAVARGREFVARVTARQKARDWQRVMREMRAMLQQLSSSELVVQDRVCTGLIGAMTRAEDMEELDYLVDQLVLRVNHLVAKLESRKTGTTVAAVTTGRGPVPSEVLRAGSEGLGEETPAGRPRRRTVLKL